MDPHGYKLSMPVMRKLYELVMTGQIVEVGLPKRPEFFERYRYIHDLLNYKNGTPTYQTV